MFGYQQALRRLFKSNTKLSINLPLKEVCAGLKRQQNTLASLRSRWGGTNLKRNRDFFEYL
jgi:hypothetical protein